MDVQLKRAKSPLDRWQVYKLYRQAFPASERKPFSIIVKMSRDGRTDVWRILRQGRFCGFATTINSERLVMLDYLAIKKAARGGGAGTAALKLLLEQYAGRGFFVEIEEPFSPGADLETRQRRRAFYRACGLEPLRVMARVFGVPMELLGRNCNLDFAGYQAFYGDRYSPFAAGHLEEMEHPEAGSAC